MNIRYMVHMHVRRVLFGLGIMENGIGCERAVGGGAGLAANGMLLLLLNGKKAVRTRKRTTPNGERGRLKKLS